MHREAALAEESMPPLEIEDTVQPLDTGSDPSLTSEIAESPAATPVHTSLSPNLSSETAELSQAATALGHDHPSIHDSAASSSTIVQAESTPAAASTELPDILGGMQNGAHRKNITLSF